MDQYKMKNKKRIEECVDILRPQIEYVASWLYDHPETALQEYRGAEMLTDIMEGQGFIITRKLEGMDTAWKAVRKNGTKGPKIALLAEFDALAGCGHACGHHMIAAMSVGAGCALATILDKYEGEVTVIGTPAEETGDGKVYLTEKHVFDEFDAAIMLHPYMDTVIHPKLIGIGGKDFIFTGKASHAGDSPWKGINALDAVILFFNNINALRQQLQDGTRVHGIIIEAGKAPNVIPDAGRVRLEWRSADPLYFEEVTEKIQCCAEGAALATGCREESHWFEPVCKGMRRDEILGPVMAAVIEGYGIDVKQDNQSGGSSDIGNVSCVIPALSPMYGVTESTAYTIHTDAFRDATRLPFAIERMITGAKILAVTGLQLFENEELLVELREEKAMLQKGWNKS